MLSSLPVYERSAVRIAAIYLLLGGLWILLSNQVLLLFSQEPRIMTQIQTYKGWGFILGTGVLLYILVRRNLSELHRSREREVQLRRQVEHTAIETATMLAKAIEERDGYTGSHCDRLAHFSQAVARRLELARGPLEQLRYAAHLHDIGKVGVPDSILNKPGKLSEEERSQTEKHVEIGANLLSPITRLRRAARMVEQHHGAWDGSGYPRGLTGEEILLEARVLAVADAYDAMTADRPYRKALSHEEAVRELRSKSGSQFDPQVVEAFLRQFE